MNNTQIQIQFPSPGEWDKFTMTAIFPDKDGFVQHCRYAQERIPGNYLEAFEGVVSVLCVLSDDWQARQVWACLHDSPAPEEENFPAPLNISEAVVLTVEAINGRGGRRMFTSADYPEFTIRTDTAVVFFKYFTGSGDSGVKNGMEKVVRE